ncbi:MAG: hypothetical protein AAGE94_01795, partial [Acidobacteriota bacterium]
SAAAGERRPRLAGADGLNLEIEIGEITLRGSPDETLTSEAIVEAIEAELERLVAFYGPPSRDLTFDLDGLVLEVDSGVTARMLGERIAADIASRWRGLGGTETDSATATETTGLDGDTSAKIE